MLHVSEFSSCTPQLAQTFEGTGKRKAKYPPSNPAMHGEEARHLIFSLGANFKVSFFFGCRTGKERGGQHTTPVGLKVECGKLKEKFSHAVSPFGQMA
jgi:hypothetical protein